MPNATPIAQAYHTDFALHTLGWKAFQDLCAQICEESLQRTISIYREAQDGGQDAVFLLSATEGIKAQSSASSALKLSKGSRFRTSLVN